MLLLMGSKNEKSKIKYFIHEKVDDKLINFKIFIKTDPLPWGLYDTIDPIKIRRHKYAKASISTPKDFAWRQWPNIYSWAMHAAKQEF